MTIAPCDSCDSAAIICQVMNEVGWTRDGIRTIPAHDSSGHRHGRCVAFDGLLFGVLRSCFVCIDTHLVMMIGCETDYPLSEFLNLVKNGEPYVTSKHSKKSSLQRELSFTE